MLSIDKNQIMIEHFHEVICISASNIQVDMNSYRITIAGDNLHVLALGKEELLIEGLLQTLAFTYEK